MYLSDMAGYAFRPEGLKRRPRASLLAAQKFLAESFFDKYKEYDRYRVQITEEATPNLFRELTNAEIHRIELKALIDDILSARDL